MARKTSRIDFHREISPSEIKGKRKGGGGVKERKKGLEKKQEKGKKKKEYIVLKGIKRIKVSAGPEAVPPPPDRPPRARGGRPPPPPSHPRRPRRVKRNLTQWCSIMAPNVNKRND